MTRETGSRLGPHEIVSALGAGGMDEVYKARDLLTAASENASASHRIDVVVNWFEELKPKAPPK